MDQQPPFSGATVLPARAAEGVPLTPLRLAAPSRHIPTQVWPRGVSCPPDQDGASDSLPALSLNLAPSDNYTFVGQRVAAPAGAPPRPYRFDSSSFAIPHDSLGRGHSDNAVRTRLPDVAAEACGAASPREPAASSESLGEGLTQASAPPTGTLDADALESLVSGTRLGDDSGTEVTDPLNRVGNPNVVVHAIQNGSVLEGPRTATAAVACHRPRTHPAGAAHGHPADTSGNNYAGYSSQSGSDNHNSHQDDKHMDDNSGRQSDDELGGDGQGERSGPRSKTNRRAQPALDGPLNCPYRKRNKQRFNIRDHVKCTKPFKDLSAVKTHVRKFHLRDTSPPQEENQAEDVEDGITKWTAEQLRDRKDLVKVCTWESLWTTLFPRDREIPLPAYERCIVMATDEFTGIANTARLCAKEVVLARVSDLLRHHYGCIDSDAIASAIKDNIDLIEEEYYAHSLRGFEHKILVPQDPPAPCRATVPGPPRSRSKRSNQPGHQGNHGPGRQIPSTGTSSQYGEQRVPLRHIAPLAPSPVRGDNTLAPPSPSPYPPQDMPPQQLGHAPNTFPLVSETGYQQWRAQGTTTFVAPTPGQYGFQSTHMPPPHLGWMGDSSAGDQFRVNMQHSQPPAVGSYPAPHPRSIATHASHTSHQHPLSSGLPGAPEARQQPPSAYGSHPSGHLRHSGFGWPGNNSTTDNNGNQDAN